MLGTIAGAVAGLLSAWVFVRLIARPWPVERQAVQQSRMGTREVVCLVVITVLLILLACTDGLVPVLTVLRSVL